ncbi:hypothetical protein ACFTY7_13180 [Streptomyces sp. NPDC057062]|uniref:hypothetical protein n=1 Tax=Streptomyces sp. NPDC057062 TaxID=3346011 RepID=UPI003630280B
MRHNDAGWQLLSLERALTPGRHADADWAGGTRQACSRTASRVARRATRSSHIRLARECLSHPREKRGEITESSLVDYVKKGSKHHLICGKKGTSSKLTATAAYVNDVARTLALVDGTSSSHCEVKVR